jgi:hypothetical protein
MSGVVIASIIPLVFLGIFLVIGLVAIFRAR